MVALFLAELCAHAGTRVSASLEETVTLADLVVEGTLVEAKAAMGFKTADPEDPPPLPVQLVVLAVTDAVKDVQAGDLVTFVVPGGMAGSGGTFVFVDGVPNFRLGDKVLLSLNELPAPQGSREHAHR